MDNLGSDGGNHTKLMLSVEYAEEATQLVELRTGYWRYRPSIRNKHSILDSWVAAEMAVGMGQDLFGV